MEKSVDHRSLMRQYLLGRLNESERSADRDLVEEYLEDDDLYQDLQDVEDQLLYQYLQDELSREDRDAFKGYLDLLPDGAEKLEFARALIRLADNDPAGETADRILGRAGAGPARKMFLLDWLEGLSRPWRYGLAGALILAIAALSFFYIFRLRSEIRQLRNEVASRKSDAEAGVLRLEELESELAARNSDTERLKGELEIARERNRAQKRLIDGFQRDMPAFISWSLMPDTLRGADAVRQTVKLPRNGGLVQIDVRMEDEGRFAGYEAVLQAGGGDIIWRQKLERPLTINGRLSLQLPAALFEKSDYTLSVELILPDNDKQPATYYYFTVR